MGLLLLLAGYGGGLGVLGVERLQGLRLPGSTFSIFLCWA